MTRQRQTIYEAILTGPAHMTAEEIYESARARMPGVARATVYRNLSLMERDGQVRRIGVAHAPDRYDRTLRPHAHILCPCCGALEDCPMDGLDAWIQTRIGRLVLALQIQAVCGACRTERAKERGEIET